VLVEQRGQVRRTGLLLALDEELERHGGRPRPGGREVGPQAEQVHGDLAPVVARTAAEQLVAHRDPGERRVLPRLQRVDGLHVVVAVDEHGRRGRVLGAQARVHRGQRRSVVPDGDLRPAVGAQGVGEPVRRSRHVTVVRRVRADRRDGDPLPQGRQELLRERGHGHSLRRFGINPVSGHDGKE
jgi:hypothetical protein